MHGRSGADQPAMTTAGGLEVRQRTIAGASRWQHSRQGRSTYFEQSAALSDQGRPIQSRSKQNLWNR